MGPAEPGSSSCAPMVAGRAGGHTTACRFPGSFEKRYPFPCARLVPRTKYAAASQRRSIGPRVRGTQVKPSARIKTRRRATSRRDQGTVDVMTRQAAYLLV